MKKLIALVISISMVLTMAVPVFADEVTVAAKPAKVQNVKVLKNGYKSLKVTWGAVDGATKYQVYRSTTGKAGSFVLKKTATGTTYTNTGITCGKTYYYKVRAVNSKGKGLFSAVKSSKVQPATAKITKVTVPNDEQVRVHWNKVSGANGYEIYRKRTDKSTWKKFRTVDTKYNYMTDKMMGNKSYPWGKYGPVWYDYADLKYEWEYKVRAYRNVNGKKVYGYFSNIEKWVPDWTIDEIFEECWKYGESLRFPLYEYTDLEEGLIEPKKDGSTYNFRHVIGSDGRNDTWGDKGMIFTNPIYGNTKKPTTFKPYTEKNSSWGPNWAKAVNPYRTKKSVMKELKPAIKYELESVANANPLFWANAYVEGVAGPNEEIEFWSGAHEFTIYCKPFLNGYKIWTLS